MSCCLYYQQQPSGAAQNRIVFLLCHAQKIFSLDFFRLNLYPVEPVDDALSQHLEKPYAPKGLCGMPVRKRSHNKQRLQQETNHLREAILLTFETLNYKQRSDWVNVQNLSSHEHNMAIHNIYLYHKISPFTIQKHIDSPINFCHYLVSNSGKA